jgi:hypothetical protein
MKLEIYPKSGKVRGVCFVCGKSTKLNIHGECSQIADAERKKVAKGKPQSRDSYERGARKATKKKYSAGELPGLSPKDLEV